LNNLLWISKFKFSFRGLLYAVNDIHVLYKCMCTIDITHWENQSVFWYLYDNFNVSAFL